MNKKVFLAVMLGLLSSRGAFAEEASPTYMMDEVVVSATKTLNSISDAGGSSVTVITAEEIENSGQETVEELIKGTPGIDVAANGGMGTKTSVFMRGADSQHTLVLIDGIPSNDPSDPNRAPNISNLTVDNIERIEIVRGPVSVLYGGSALAGVINIITKKGGKVPATYVGAEGGSYGTMKFYGGTSGSQGKVDYAFALSRLKTDGFSVYDENNACINPTNLSFEKDGYANTTLSANIGARINETTSLEGTFRYTDARVDVDSFGADVPEKTTDSEQFSGRVALKMKYQSLFSTAYLNISDQNRDNRTGDVSEDTFHGHTYEIGWQGDLSLIDAHVTSLGVSYQNENMRNEDFSPASMLSKEAYTGSIFLQDQWSIGDMKLVGGVRYDNHEIFGDTYTYRLAPSYTYGNTVYKFSYGTGFKAPSLYELFGPYGNSELKAESSTAWDAGFEHRFSPVLKVGSTYFHTEVDDRIDFDRATSLYTQIAGSTTITGVESFAEWQLTSDLFFGLNHTYTYTQDADNEELVRRPKNKVAFSGSWNATKKAKLHGSMQWVGSRRDSGAKDADCNTTGKLESYFLANVSASYDLNGQVRLYGRIDNLFDAYYEEAWTYASVGRSAYAGVKVSF
ncbi:MAG: TonB-dependent receptor [Pelodictyon luteolum]|uniref:TonB-dependent receptor n=1 Tax=Pelodictyon luteolum TaxID=1100 RepID=A0A165MEW1_PELLU|nr:TonB-dependent receptor [Pelodictyon luteolum]KZK75164.1 MAG: TonB-dependent receptor [Pelodictyon luteolum]